MANWNLPLTTTPIAQFLSQINGKSVDAAQRFLNNPINPQEGFVRFARLLNNRIKIQERGPISWLDRILAVESGGRGEAGALEFSEEQLNQKLNAGDNISIVDVGETLELRTSALNETEVDDRITTLVPTDVTVDTVNALLEAGDGIDINVREGRIYISRDTLGSVSGVVFRRNSSLTPSLNTWVPSTGYGFTRTSLSYLKQQANTILRFSGDIHFLSTARPPQKIRFRLQSFNPTSVNSAWAEVSYDGSDENIGHAFSVDLSNLAGGARVWIINVQFFYTVSTQGSVMPAHIFRADSSVKIEERYS